MKLVKIFDEYRDIIVRGGSFLNIYPALYKVVRKEGMVTRQKIVEYVKHLQQKYPDRGFNIREVKIKNRPLIVIDRKSYLKLPNGKRKYVWDRVPIYIDLDRQEFFVPKSYIVKKQKLTNYIIMRTLGALGVATVKYLKTL